MDCYQRKLDFQKMQIMIRVWIPEYTMGSTQQHLGKPFRFKKLFKRLFPPCSFRFGHTMIPEEFQTRTSTGTVAPVQTRSQFFSPGIIGQARAGHQPSRSFYNHGGGPYWALLLVESGYYSFPI